jgi:citrate lyase beta subunit
MNYNNVTCAVDLGVPLYIPGDHPHLFDFISGVIETKAGSFFICFEDAVLEKNYLSTEKKFLKKISDKNIIFKKPIFVRPKNLEQLERFCCSSVSCFISGFLVPKVSNDSLKKAFDITLRHGHWLIPILETNLVFRPSKLESILDLILSYKERLLMARVGGNDLLGLLGTKRDPLFYSFNGPIAANISLLQTMFISNGICVSGIVYDHIIDLKGLFIESSKDVSMALLPKAAIHPSQVDVIYQAYRVYSSDLALALRILDIEGPAVFKCNGYMIEKATHSAWAKKTILRSRVFGTH